MSSLLNYLNNATDMFGGAIDIIIIKQPDGALRSTPFHVRFGRLKVLRSTEKNIRILINGKLTDMVMRINSTDGVAYFVQDDENQNEMHQAEYDDSYEKCDSSESLDVNLHNFGSKFEDGDKENHLTHDSNLNSQNTFVELGNSNHESQKLNDQNMYESQLTNNSASIMDQRNITIKQDSEAQNFNSNSEFNPKIFKKQQVNDETIIRSSFSSNDSLQDISPLSEASFDSNPSFDNSRNHDYLQGEGFDEELETNAINDSTSDLDRRNEELLRKSAEETEREMEEKERLAFKRRSQKDVSSQISQKENGVKQTSTSKPSKISLLSSLFSPRSNGATPTTSEKQSTTTTPSSILEEKKPRWQWMKKIFGLNEEKEETVEKDDYVEQSLKETFHKKYNFDIDEVEEDRGDEQSPVFEIEDISSSRPLPREKTDTLKKYTLTTPRRLTRRKTSDAIPISRTITKPPKFLNSSYDNLTDHDDNVVTLTPSLPKQIRESIKELNQRPMAASLPQNFGASKMRKYAPSTLNESDSMMQTSKNVKFNESDNSVTHGDNSTSSQANGQTTWKWWFKSVPQQQKGPPKLRLKLRSKPLQRQLQALDLKRGKNTIKYVVTGRVLGTQEIEANLYLWNYDDRIVISDVDGTITRSDGLGHVLPLLGMDWSHPGIAELYTSIVKNGYKIIYLTARSIVQSAATRVYISSLRQGKLSLPEGPVIMSSDRLFACLTREVILRRPEEFKIATLQEIKSLFDSNDNPQPFFAGFGNRITDTISYKTVGIPDHKIFTIDHTGKILHYDTLRHESYESVHQLVHLMFPDVKSKFISTDLSYWNLSIPSVKSIENLRKLEENEDVQSS